MILQIAGPNGKPDADLIEAISYSSINPYFRTVSFRKALIKYRQRGCTAEHPRPNPSPERIERAIKARENSIKGQFLNKCE
jgi:hypothetical protein